MQHKIVKAALVAALVVAAVAFTAAVPARADGGNPFKANDNRVSPLTGDRVAVYCNQNFAGQMSIGVLGIDGDANGFNLTTFSQDELTSGTNVTHNTPAGSVTLTLDQAPQATTGFITINNVTTNQEFVTQPDLFHVTWTGGPFGADGSLPFVKHFSFGYNFTPTNTSH